MTFLRFVRSGPTVAVLAGLTLLSLVTTAAAGGVRPGGKGFGFGSGSPAAESEALRNHVLNRLSYGPSPASVAEIRSIGVDEYIRRQLNPEVIDETQLQIRLEADLPDPYDDTLPEAALYQWPHFYQEHLLRARYSERQLQEVMVQFWENHFTTVVVRGNNGFERHFWARMEFDENAELRANALGKFSDLLTASAKSQAMMYFLDNYRSTVFTLNENYGREILELHSLGVDCGYDQEDVTAVSQIFTGWSGIGLGRDPNPCSGPNDPVGCDPTHVVDGTFFFNGRAHDNSNKTALGYTFPAGQGLAEGLRVIDIVSQHPCTANFLSRKLLEVFVTDQPSLDLVERIAGVFMDTDGDIKLVLQAIFDSPEFRSPEQFRAKVKTPLEFSIASLRALDGRLGNRPSDGAINQEIYRYIELQGMELFDYPIPTGYEESGGEWVSANVFLQRWKHADRLSFWYPGNNRYTWIEPMATVAERGLTSAEAVVDHFSLMLAGPGLPEDRKQQLIDTLTNGTGDFDPGIGGQETRLRTMISHLLGSPEFTKQ